MSRSKHQRHPTFRNKYKRIPWCYRKRKMKPYGLKPFTGYGEEYYFKSLNEEIIFDVCSRSYQKKQNEKEIKTQLEEMNNTLDF